MEVMLANKWDKKKKVKFAQPKLDGIRCKGAIDEMKSRTNKPIISQPHIQNEINILFKELSKTGVLFLDGELYNHELNDDFEKIKGLVTRSKNIKPEENEKYIQYHVYDICMPNTSFTERMTILYNEFIKHELKYIKLVATYPAVSKENELHKKMILEGYEGTIYRTDDAYTPGRSKSLLKRKEFQDQEFKIIDIIEGKGKLQGVAGNVVFDSFSASIGMDYEAKRRLLENKAEYIGKLATVQYFTIKDGVPRFPVLKTVRDYE